MPRFRLRHDQNEIDLPKGDFVIGRSLDCDLVLDDALVSRRHAVFTTTDANLFVEDLGSRNGVKVNHVRKQGRVKLESGDTITVGGHQFQVTMTEGQSVAARARTQTAVSEAPIEQPTVMGLRADLIEKAIAVGKIEEAQRILQSFLTLTMAQVGEKPLDLSLMMELTGLTIRIASETRKASWLEWVFDLHAAAQRVMQAATVDELMRLARPARLTYSQPVRSYVEWVRTRTGSLSASEKFAVQRIEGLARMLSSQ